MPDRPRIYVGHKRDGSMEIFKSSSTPTEDSHGDKYFASTGPFYTMAGAKFMRDHGKNNPHVQCVADAERLARLEKAGRL
jgi:hypothetical protein